MTLVEHRACPCLHTTPCDPRCTCVNGFSSSGCRRCCSYGSPEQQLKAAEHLASLIDRPLVRVGVAVLLRQGSAVLMGLRKGSHGAGTWSFPGGHLEPGETVIECAARELREETGIALDPHDFRKVTFTNDVFEAEGRHYVTLYMETSRGAGLAKPKVLEPDKCAEWRWWSEPPSDLFLPIRNLLADGFEIWR